MAHCIFHRESARKTEVFFEKRLGLALRLATEIEAEGEPSFDLRFGSRGWLMIPTHRLGVQRESRERVS